MPMPRNTILAKEIVEKYKLSYHTVNYYTAIGLLPVLSKKGNNRIYDEDVVKERLAKISSMITEGYPLRLIRRKLNNEP